MTFAKWPHEEFPFCHFYDPWHIDPCSMLIVILNHLKVERSGKNAVTFAEWPHEEYPKFAAGLAYFLTRCGYQHMNMLMLMLMLIMLPHQHPGMLVYFLTRWGYQHIYADADNVTIFFPQGGCYPIICGSILRLLPLVPCHPHILISAYILISSYPNMCKTVGIRLDDVFLTGVLAAKANLLVVDIQVSY